jgi:hypothetical protein
MRMVLFAVFQLVGLTGVPLPALQRQPRQSAWPTYTRPGGCDARRGGAREAKKGPNRAPIGAADCNSRQRASTPSPRCPHLARSNDPSRVSVECPPPHTHHNHHHHRTLRATHST